MAVIGMKALVAVAAMLLGVQASRLEENYYHRNGEEMVTVTSYDKNFNVVKVERYPRSWLLGRKETKYPVVKAQEEETEEQEDEYVSHGEHSQEYSDEYSDEYYGGEEEADYASSDHSDEYEHGIEHSHTEYEASSGESESYANEYAAPVHGDGYVDQYTSGHVNERTNDYAASSSAHVAGYENELGAAEHYYVPTHQYVEPAGEYGHEAYAEPAHEYLETPYEEPVQYVDVQPVRSRYVEPASTAASHYAAPAATGYVAPAQSAYSAPTPIAEYVAAPSASSEYVAPARPSGEYVPAVPTYRSVATRQYEAPATTTTKYVEPVKPTGIRLAPLPGITPIGTLEYEQPAHYEKRPHYDGPALPVVPGFGSPAIIRGEPIAAPAAASYRKPVHESKEYGTDRIQGNSYALEQMGLLPDY